jgi:hypothetical protein
VRQPNNLLLTDDFALGERLLQFLHCGIRHFGIQEDQTSEFFQFFEFLQSLVRHFWAAKAKRGEILEFLEFFQSSVCHFGNTLFFGIA